MNRTGWMGVALVAVIGVGTWSALRWPSSEPALSCEPSQVIWEDVEGALVARCANPGEDVHAEGRPPVPAGQAMTLGRKLDLNTATVEDLALVPGVGARFGKVIVEERERLEGGFQSWEEVDDIRGVGPARMEALREAAELRDAP